MILAGGFFVSWECPNGVGEVEARRNRSDIRIEVLEERIMTDTEVEAVASLLFTWWKGEFEHQSQERLESKLREQ